MNEYDDKQTNERMGEKTTTKNDMLNSYEFNQSPFIIIIII